MSNLGRTVWEKGKEAEKTATIERMYQKGYSLEMIADASDKTPEEVETVLTGRKLRTD